MYLNYPRLLDSPFQYSPTKANMSKECKAAIQTYTAIPDLACLMLVKICQILIACISTFQRMEGVTAPWTRFFKGSRGLCWDLSMTPTHQIMMGLYSRLQFLPSHFMLTFEEAFYTGVFLASATQQSLQPSHHRLSSKIHCFLKG